MIVALYRVPGTAALNRRYEDPFDQLWHRLGTTYGPALKRRPEARSHRASPGSRMPLTRGVCGAIGCESRADLSAATCSATAR
jgi:hypothetical protein